MLGLRPFSMALPIVVALFWLTGAVAEAGHHENQEIVFQKGQAIIQTSSGMLYFDVEMATSDAQRIQGLQFRDVLAPDAGMLFDFGYTRRVAMWMKDTLISLDMLFIDVDGMIRHIYHDAEPLSLSRIDSHDPVRGVLELPAGTATRLGIKPGDRLISPVFGKFSNQ